MAHTFVYFCTQSPLTLRHLSYLGTSFVYTLVIPCGRLVIQLVSFRSSSFVKRLPAKCSFIFGNRKKPRRCEARTVRRMLEDVPMELLTTTRLVSAGQYADVHCRATEQFHARSCLFGKVTLYLIGLQKTNNTSLITVGGILNRHSHGHSYLCTHHVTRSDVQLPETIFNITLNTRNQ